MPSKPAERPLQQHEAWSLRFPKLVKSHPTSRKLKDKRMEKESRKSFSLVQDGLPRRG
jgi:hypothetical protein